MFVMVISAMRRLVFCFVGLGLVSGGSAAIADSPTDNANTTAEYNTYVYTYNARAMVLNLPSAIDAQYQASSSSSERFQLNSEGFWAEMLNMHIDRAFNHALDALDGGGISDWRSCLQDLNSAINACDDLLEFQQGMNNPSKARMSAVRSCKWYLNIAADNCFTAAWSFLWSQQVIGGRW